MRQWQVAAGLIYGQVKKCYRRRKLVRVTHVMRLGTEAALKAALQGLGFSGRLNTAFIERVNLTVRHGVAALARRTWAMAQQAPQLLAHLEWWRAYYHFVRPHASLRVALVQRESEVATVGNATGNVPQPWQREEPTEVDGHPGLSPAARAIGHRLSGMERKDVLWNGGEGLLKVRAGRDGESQVKVACLDC